ncbi:MAG TPA: pyridoxamine 5'-phosphate oxidase family protein [Acidimicrobiales bacterium]
MRGLDGRIGIEAMDRPECLKRLRANKLGRVAVVIEGHPVLSPITYAVTDELIVFRIAKGSKLDRALRGGPVSFEIDDADLAAGTGWSVIVTGWARVATTPAQADHFATLGLPAWADDDSDDWIVVHPERISGRRLVPQEDLTGG